jgi:hypothetical protein
MPSPLLAIFKLFAMLTITMFLLRSLAASLSKKSAKRNAQTLANASIKFSIQYNIKPIQNLPINFGPM